MTSTVTLPLWLLLVILGFGAVTFASHFLFPSVRWFFRRRLEKLVARLNQRLDRPIEPFRLARRKDMIVRLSYGPQVLQAVALLHKSVDGGGSPIPGRTYPTASVTGVPSAVKPFRTATRTWNSAT